RTFGGDNFGMNSHNDLRRFILKPDSGPSISSSQRRGENLSRALDWWESPDRGARVSISEGPCREPAAEHRAAPKRAALSARSPALLLKCCSSGTALPHWVGAPLRRPRPAPD